MPFIYVKHPHRQFHEQQTAAWAKVGINTFRADTMTEAISRLISNDDYIFIAINEDTIDYLTELKMMRGSPICRFSS